MSDTFRIAAPCGCVIGVDAGHDWSVGRTEVDEAWVADECEHHNSRNADLLKQMVEWVEEALGAVLEDEDTGPIVYLTKDEIEQGRRLVGKYRETHPKEKVE